RPDVVEPKYMIHMAMRYQHRIQPPDIRPQRLLPKIRRGVDQHGLPGMLDQYRDPQPLIARIVGHTRLTIARDRRHASGSPCSEKGQFHPSWPSFLSWLSSLSFLSSL